MGYIRVPRFLLLCGLSHERPKEGVWQARSGVRLFALRRHGVPFGRARAILLYLACKSGGSGRLVRGSLDEIREMLAVDWSLANLEDHLLRVFYCSYEIAIAGCPCGHDACQKLESLDVLRALHYCRATRAFEVTLGDALLGSEDESFLCPCAPALELVKTDQLQALDLFLWYHWKLAQSDHATVDPFGPSGPFGLVPITRARSRQPSRLEQLHAAVLAVWPACPFRVVGEAGIRRIVYDPTLPSATAGLRKLASATAGLLELA